MVEKIAVKCLREEGVKGRISTITGYAGQAG